MKKAENVLIICTDKSMIDMYRNVLGDMEIEIDIEYIGNRFGADIHAFLNHIKEFEKQGKEIIITRGYLANEIRRSLDFKVIEISISAFDVLKALYKYADRKDLKVAAVECSAFIEVIMQAAEFLDMEITPYVVDEFGDFYKGFTEALNDGADVICGGAMGHYDDFFLKIDAEYAYVDSSESSMRDSLFNALEVYQLVHEEKKKRELIETLVNVSDVGTIAADSEGHIIAANRKAAELCKFNLSEAVGKKIENLESAVSFSDIQDVLSKPSGIFEIMGSKILVDKVPISIGDSEAGYVLRMKRTDQILIDDSRVRSILAQKGLQARYTLDDIKGKSEVISRLKNQVEHYARTDSTVLINGESGSGKELFAQAVHNASMRKHRPFLAINCPSFPPHLLESELFGYVSGAFTGARKEGKIGVFELAHTGTLFLDEIGDMDLSVQSKILRAVQEKEIMRVGDDKIISIDVRIIAATNKNLFEEVLKGNFREDLYYRLNILNINVPPLREHKEDIAELTESALYDINERLGCSITGISDDVIKRLNDYDWYGNVRELNNFVEKMIAMVRSGKITMGKVEGLFYEMDRQIKVYRDFYRNSEEQDTLTQPIMTLKEAEMIAIDRALRDADYNKTKAAEMLGIDRGTLMRKLQSRSREQVL